MQLSTAPALSPADAASSDGRQSRPVSLSWRRRRVLAFASVGAAAYLIALVAGLPARLLVAGEGTTGTIWNGEAGLPGGSRVAWRWAPLRSLIGVGFAADWRMTGPDTSLGGRALLRPGGLVLDEVSGSANGALLDLIGGMPFSCDFPMQVRLDRIVLGSGDRALLGEIRSDAGNCQANGAAAVTQVPPLIATGEPRPRGRTQLSVAPLGRRRTLLVDGQLSADGRMSLRVTPEGAGVLPFGMPGGLSIETEL